MNKWKIYILALVIFALLGPIVIIGLTLTNNQTVISNIFTGMVSSSLVQPASAQEIYPLFECPCCGKPIDQCECPMAKERVAYINGLADAKQSEDEVILTYIKKYGLDSFIDKDRQQIFREKLINEASADRPIISFNVDSYDFGDVSQKDGVVTAFFEFKNDGKNDLIIDRLDSSCGCTSASIIYQDEEGPIFVMAGHGKDNPTDWQVAVKPGETAYVKVYYDPSVHPDFRGSATREVSIFSNDPIDFENKVKIELNQID